LSANVNEELQHKAMLGEKATRLLENEDLREFVDAYDAFLLEQEQMLTPRDTNQFTVLRSIRRGLGEFIGTFIPGIQAEGEAARMEQQGVSPDKRIIL